MGVGRTPPVSLETAVKRAGEATVADSPADPPALSGRGCRFPLWRDTERPAYGAHRFCEAVRVPGRPYCAPHHRLCSVGTWREVAMAEARARAEAGRPGPRSLVA